MYLSYNQGKIMTPVLIDFFCRRLHTTTLKTFNLYKALFNMLNIHPSVLRGWVHHTSDTCIFTLAQTPLVKHFHINVHVLLYLSPFFSGIRTDDVNYYWEFYYDIVKKNSNIGIVNTPYIETLLQQLYTIILFEYSAFEWTK